MLAKKRQNQNIQKKTTMNTLTLHSYFRIHKMKSIINELTKGTRDHFVLHELALLNS